MTTTTKHIEAFIELAISLGWTAELTTEASGRQYIDLYYMPDSGEDFGFTVFEIGSIEDIRKDVYNYYENFDIEEHVTEWLEAKKSGVSGVPPLMTLIDGTKEIDEKLKELSDKVIDLSLNYEEEDYE